MDFLELKKKAQKTVALNETDVIKDTDELLNVGYIEISTTQKVIFSVSAFKGKKYFSIRNWMQAESGEWTPTKKGIHLSFEKFEEFEKNYNMLAQVIKLDQ